MDFPGFRHGRMDGAVGTAAAECSRPRCGRILPAGAHALSGRFHTRCPLNFVPWLYKRRSFCVESMRLAVYMICCSSRCHARTWSCFVLPLRTPPDHGGEENPNILSFMKITYNEFTSKIAVGWFGVSNCRILFPGTKLAAPLKQHPSTNKRAETSPLIVSRAHRYQSLGTLIQTHSPSSRPTD